MNRRLWNGLLLLLLLSLFSCELPRRAYAGFPTQPYREYIRFESLTCLNLSEKMAGVGTLNDE
ncbi:MAG: hypothetical protein AAFO94_18230, partial [Bacteroidota bacterium]